MLDYANLGFLNNFIELKIYEFEFIESLQIVDRIIYLEVIVLKNICNSHSLRYILCLILKIGNIIGYTYSSNKKKIQGLKLESLDQVLNYKSKNNYLFEFVIEMLKVNSFDINNFINEFEMLTKNNQTDLESIKNNLNDEIHKFKEKLNIFYSMDSEYQKHFSNFFGYGSEMLKNTSKEYYVAYELTVKCKKLFGEDPNSNFVKVKQDIFILIESLRKYLN
ncbi:hypothetical protein A0H76_522 [Hepatospora eriocheir]|uniref:FH2 domain-containing protein n=1 Tax=Hepatospora eriocheir TaxID=1081669 RepID=A0A1X0Q8M7_9MICR|nr:hypothetical protein A0H76_522 [Hepatospora eriocheir]